MWAVHWMQQQAWSETDEIASFERNESAVSAATASDRRETAFTSDHHFVTRSHKSKNQSRRIVSLFVDPTIHFTACRQWEMVSLGLVNRAHLGRWRKFQYLASVWFAGKGTECPRHQDLCCIRFGLVECAECVLDRWIRASANVSRRDERIDASRGSGPDEQERYLFLVHCLSWVSRCVSTALELIDDENFFARLETICLLSCPMGSNRFGASLCRVSNVLRRYPAVKFGKAMLTIVSPASVPMVIP